MRSKIILVILLATRTMSSSIIYDTNEKDFKRYVDKLPKHTDLPTGPKEQIVHKFLTAQSNNYVQSQLENFLLETPGVGEDLIIRNRINLIQKEDSVLGNLFLKLYEKARAINCKAEKIVRFVTTDEENEEFVQPLDHDLLNSLKRFEELISNVH